MHKTHRVVELHRTDPRMVVRVERAEGVCLAAAVVISAASLLGRIAPELGDSSLKWMQMSLSASAAGLACATGLAFSTAKDSRRTGLIRTSLGFLTAFAGLMSLAGTATVSEWVPRAWHVIATANAESGTMPGLVTLAFLCLAVVLLFAQTEKGIAGWVPDLMLFGAGWVVLSLSAGATLGSMQIFGAGPPAGISPATIIVLALLTLAAVGRRAEHGRFSIFLGRGLGSRIARGILPIVLTLPLGRELMRARLTRLHLFPEHYAVAFLASAGTMIALGLLIAVSWQLRRLEWEIQNLSLRDELTGLYNLRGFQLLAEQAFRMARRSQMPFSVLFVDVDNLKQINDRLGHGVGSQMLVETAEFLKSNFRETDVLGRIGGDEFAVAGQLGLDAIELAEERLDVNSVDDELVGRPRLSLSMGHVTADPRRHESLQDLLDRADAAMYERKRMKKLQAT